jgi:hypothetical protein
MDRRGPDSLERAPQRKRAFEFIKGELAAGREFPSYGAIANHMGWKNSQSARDCVQSLADLDRVLTRKHDAVLGRAVFFIAPQP